MIEFLESYAKNPPVSFHMPGHKGRRIFDECHMGRIIENLTDMDITELSGADNLFQAEGIIRKLMDRYRNIYGCRESYLLVGGSTAGVLAAVMTCLRQSKKLILPSNCHKSAINALTLTGGIPVYVDPEIIGEFSVSGEVAPETIKKALEENPDADAVLVTSPNYYGICSDIKEIARISSACGVPLIVDQAHGAHLKIMEDVVGKEKIGIKDKAAAGSHILDAGSLGADIVIEGIHKSLASFTQTAVVNIYSDRVDLERFSDFLQMVESSSPSYMMMASLDMNARIIEEYGDSLIKAWLENLYRFYREAESVEGLEVLNHPLSDKTKLVISMRKLGLSGKELFTALEERRIMLELYTGEIALGLSGIGNTGGDYQKLLDALKDISKGSKSGSVRENQISRSMQEAYNSGGCEAGSIYQSRLYSHGRIGKIPASVREVHYSEAQGLIAAISITPYPPGIPLIVPGEVIEKEKIEYAARLQEKGVTVIGMTPAGYVKCGQEGTLI
jgi:arginine/lysine/ornithine decarboxylase